MILDSDNEDMSITKTPVESPPAYSNVDYPQFPHPSNDGPAPKQIELVPPPHSSPSMPPTAVYHYVHPITQEHVASLLPPDHPEMICLQEGTHVVQTNFGILGILAAIFWFPLGIGLCILDRKVKCRRCGLVIHDGVCG